MAKGFKLLEKGELKWVCYDRITGQMYHGEAIDSGNWYYFDEYTGATYYGFDTTLTQTNGCVMTV